jgi:hypothetical protein
LANFISKWIAHRTMRSLIKTDLNSEKAREITDQKTLAKFIYHNHDNIYKKYGISFDEVEKVVVSQQVMKKGFMAKVAIKRASDSIQKAIKEDRIKFVNEDAIDYIDKDKELFHYTFNEMAERIMENVGGREKVAMLGITDLDILDILSSEYGKRKL